MCVLVGLYFIWPPTPAPAPATSTLVSSPECHITAMITGCCSIRHCGAVQLWNPKIVALQLRCRCRCVADCGLMGQRDFSSQALPVSPYLPVLSGASRGVPGLGPSRCVTMLITRPQKTSLNCWQIFTPNILTDFQGTVSWVNCWREEVRLPLVPALPW